MTINAPRMLPNRIGTFPYPPMSVPHFSAVPKRLFPAAGQIHPFDPPIDAGAGGW
jgi:hypothetical protein